MNEIIQKLNPKNIWEIGVGNADICRTKHYLGTNIQLKLFEVNPKTYANLIAAYGRYSNVHIYNFGLYDKNDIIDFLEDGDSTCCSEVQSPTAVLGTVKMGGTWVANKPRVKMSVRDMAEIDVGDIDVALIDTEGCEYKIVSRMKSRPRFMSLETHNEWYKTPNYEELLYWTQQNGYKLIHTDTTDSWFLREDVSI